MMDSAYMAYRELRIAENKKRRLKTVRRQRIIMALLIAILIAGIIFLTSRLVLEAHSDTIDYKYYTTVEVHSGDTLASLSKEYMSPSRYKDIDSYMKEVKNINHLDENYTIVAGSKIILPYYSYEFK